MKNFNILGIHGKIRVLGGGSHKTIYRGDCLKRGGGGWQERGIVFEGGLIPQCTLCNVFDSPWQRELQCFRNLPDANTKINI